MHIRLTVAKIFGLLFLNAVVTAPIFAATIEVPWVNTQREAASARKVASKVYSASNAFSGRSGCATRRAGTLTTTSTGIRYVKVNRNGVPHVPA